MKINAIKIPKNSQNPVLKPVSKTGRNNFLKSLNFDTLAFKSFSAKHNIREIDKYIENKALCNNVKKNLLTQDDGSYNEELEKNFLLYYETAVNSLDSVDSQYKKDAMAKAILETFRAAKNYDNSNLNMDMLNLIIQAYSAIMHNQTNVCEVFNACKNQEGKIDTQKANKIFFWQASATSVIVPPQKAAEYINKYCQNKLGIISDDKINKISILLNCCYCPDDEFDEMVRLVLEDGNDLKSDINLDKYQFLVSKMLELYSVSVEEYDKNYDIDLNRTTSDTADYEQKAELSDLIVYLSRKLLKKIMSNCTDMYKDFDIQKANQDFDFILKYAQDYRYNLNATKIFKISNPNMGNLYKKEISLNELEGITAAKYDSSVYRMYRILCEENIGQQYLN